MAIRITDECIECGACLAVCPAGAIEEGENKFIIVQDLCTQCGACVHECPLEAIVNDTA